MKPDPAAMQSFVTDIVTNWWTPVFVLMFVAIVVYALLPRYREKFDEAARMPLKDD